MNLTKLLIFLLGILTSPLCIFAQCPSVSEVNDGSGSPDYSFTVTGASCAVSNGGNTITQGFNNGVESILIIAEGASLTINEEFYIYDSVKVYGDLIVNGDVTVASQDGVAGVLYIVEGGSAVINGDYYNGTNDEYLLDPILPIVKTADGDPGETVVEGDMEVTGTYHNRDGGTTTVPAGGTLQSNEFDQEGGTVEIEGGDPSDCEVGCCGGGCSSLPVTLTRFELEEHDNQVIVKWTTSQELNNDYFIVQRKVGESKDFEDVSTIDGQGTTSDVNHYQFSDLRDFAELRYRLVQVDFDGKTTVYPSKRVLKKDRHSVSIGVYPNPAVNHVNIRTDAVIQAFQLVDSGGRVLTTGSSSDVAEVEKAINEIIEIQSGYFLLSFVVNGELVTKSLIKH